MTQRQAFISMKKILILLAALCLLLAGCMPPVQSLRLLPGSTPVGMQEERPAHTLPPETEATAVEAKTIDQPAKVNRELLLWLCVAAGLTVALLTLTIILIVRQAKRKKAPIEK